MSNVVTERSIKVLVCDDYGLTRDMVKAILRQLGFNDIVGYEDGAAALQALREDVYGLIICDWNMPRMSGLSLLREIRSDPNLKSIPFLMLTAEAYRENVVEALRAGVNDYVVKPFTSHILSEKVDKVLAEAKK